MPGVIIILMLAAFGFRLLTGGYYIIKPSLFVATVSTMAICLFLLCLKKEVRKPIEARMLTIAVAMPLLAWCLPSVGALLLIMCVWVPLAAGRFSLLAPVYLFSLLLLPGLDGPLMIGSFKLVDFGVHDALALGAAVAIFVNPAKAKCRMEWDIMVFAVVVLIAMALARDTTASHNLRVITEVSLDFALPYYIVSRGVRSADEMRAALLWLGGAAVLLAALLIFELWKSWPIYYELYRAHEMQTVLMGKVRGGFIRASGPLVEPTSMAMLLGLCFVALYLSRTAFRNRYYFLLALTVVGIGLIAPQSRSAWIGTGIAIALADLLCRRYAQLAGKLVVAGGALSALLLAAQFSPSLSETLGLSGASSETTDYRRMLLDRGLQEISQHPITGHSLQQLQHLLSDLVQGEGIIDFVNTYIWIMLLSGIGGLIIFCTPIIYFLARVFKEGRFGRRDGRNVELGAFVFAVLFMFSEMFFFTSFGTRPAMFQFILFGFGDAFIRFQRQGAETPDAVPQAATPGLLAPPPSLLA